MKTSGSPSIKAIPTESSESKSCTGTKALTVEASISGDETCPSTPDRRIIASTAHEESESVEALISEYYRFVLASEARDKAATSPPINSAVQVRVMYWELLMMQTIEWYNRPVKIDSLMESVYDLVGNIKKGSADNAGRYDLDWLQTFHPASGNLVRGEDLKSVINETIQYVDGRDTSIKLMKYCRGAVYFLRRAFREWLRRSSV